MIQDLIDQTRKWDRSVADTMELVLSRLDTPGRDIEDLELHDYPLDQRESTLFHLAMTFGALADRMDEREAPSVPERFDGHQMIRSTLMLEEQVVQPAPNGFAIMDVSTRGVNDVLGYECICGDSFDDGDSAKAHVARVRRQER